MAHIHRCLHLTSFFKFHFPAICFGCLSASVFFLIGRYTPSISPDEIYWCKYFVIFNFIFYARFLMTNTWFVVSFRYLMCIGLDDFLISGIIKIKKAKKKFCHYERTAVKFSRNTGIQIKDQWWRKNFWFLVSFSWLLKCTFFGLVHVVVLCQHSYHPVVFL